MRRLLPVLVLAGACHHPATPARPAPAPVDPALDAIAQQAVADAKLPGLAVAVIVDGRPVLEKAYGDLALDRAVPIGSLTKQFTAAAVEQLVDAGKIALDAPVARYLPSVQSTATIAQLLGQTSGIPDFSRPENLGKTGDQVLAWIAAAPAEHAPGDGYAYSNSNYFLLGRVVAAVSGQSFDDYLRDHVIAAAGLTATSVCPDTAPVPPRWFEGAGELCGTVLDLVRWHDALAGGQVVSAAAFARMTTAGQGDYGAGLVIDALAGHRRIWHNGAIPLTSESELIGFPDDRIVIAILVDKSQPPGGQLADAVAHPLQQKLLAIPADVVRDEPVDAATLAAIVGTYRAGTVAVVIDAVDGKPRVTLPDGQTTRLLYQGNGRFVLDSNRRGAYQFDVMHGPSSTLGALLDGNPVGTLNRAK